jgi:methionine-rich copper-binding protein CopC
VVSDKKPIAINNMLLSIDSALVYQYMQFIAQPRHHTAAPAGLSLIKDSIEANFTRFNLQTQRSAFNFSTYGGENIIGRKPGLMQEKNTIIVDAHFDAVANSPGADDNGSSLAAVLIASKILAPYQFEKTLNFIGFDKEENGLLGSAYYVNNSIPSYQQTDAVLNMEMIGYYSDAPNSQSVPAGFSQLFPAAVDSINTGGNKGVWLFTVGNTNSASLSLAFDTIARNYVSDVKSLVLNVPANGQIAPDLRRSDHASFWDAGFKALMLTDGADFRNANYHTPGDSLGTLNIPFLVRNIKAITAAAAVLAHPVSAHAAVAGAWQLIKDIPFSIDEKKATLGVEVYPNPTHEELYLKFNKNITSIQVKLENATGKIVAQQTINNVAQNTTIKVPIASSELAAGIYYLTAFSNDFNCVKKIVISQPHNH